MGDKDVRRLDVTVQQLALMGVVQCLADRGDDPDHLVRRHAVRVLLLQQARRIGALDVVHRDPQLALELAAVVDADDVRVPQRRGDVGLAVEPLAVLRVVGERGRQHLERVITRQSWVLGQIDLAHPPGTQVPQDRVARETLAIGQRHARILQVVQVWLRATRLMVR